MIQFAAYLLFSIVLIIIGWFIVDFLNRRKIKRQKKLLPVELSVDTKTIMLDNWEQLNLTGDIRWLIIDKQNWDRIKEISSSKFRDSYFSVHDDYSKITGISEKMERWRDLMILRMEARELLAEGEKHQINHVNNFSAQIDAMMKAPDEGNVDLIKHRMSIRKLYEQPIDPKTTSLYEFLQITELITEIHKSRTTKDSHDATSD